MGVVVRRYIDILTIMINFPYSPYISSFLGRSIRPFVMYCVNGKPRSSLLIESTDSMILLLILIVIFILQ